MATLDIDWVRRQFPALQQNAIFADAPGGTQVTSGVIAAVSDYLLHANANVHGPFRTSRRTDEVLLEAHKAVADLLGCDREEIVFGANMTTLTFAISRALGRELQPGDEILTTLLDHDANVAPWQALEERGVKLLSVDIHPEDCTLDIADFERKLSKRTKIVAIGYASNAVGTINPVGRVIEMAQAVGALVFVDAVHYAPHGSIDVKTLGCDFLACSAYKFFGPHVGILYGRLEHLDRLKPYKVRPASEALPDRWETGTQNHEGIAGVHACISYLSAMGRHHGPGELNRREALQKAYELVQSHEQQLSRRLVTGLLAIPAVTLYGIPDTERLYERTPTVGIRVANRTPAEVAAFLGDRDIFTWSGNFYALNLTERLNLELSGGLLRIGFAHYNTCGEIDRLLAALDALSSAQ